MLHHDNFTIAPKAVIGDSANNPAAVIENIDQYVFKFEGVCDGKFAKKLAKLIEAEKKHNLR